jgi:uncharacterized integral membrane protein
VNVILSLLKIALFVAAITFAVVNTDMVSVRYYFGLEWRAPMVLVLLAAFGLGVAAGILVCLPRMVRSRFEVSRLRREAARDGERDAQREEAPATAVALPDAAAAPLPAPVNPKG